MDGTVRKAALCAVHAKACGWLHPQGWALLEGWKLAPGQEVAPPSDGDALLQSALSAMVDSVASMTDGHFKSVSVQLHKIGPGGEVVPHRASAAACPQCGFTVADWKKLGRLGCPGCYRAFAGAIRHQLPHLHGGATVHWGRIPQGDAPGCAAARRQRIARLKERLGAAIDSEDYEQASLLRDRILELEKRLC